jgi:hypothetical protein
MSVEAVGACPAAKRPTRLSSLSTKEHTMPVGVLATFSPACLGSTLSKMACHTNILACIRSSQGFCPKR